MDEQAPDGPAHVTDRTDLHVRLPRDLHEQLRYLANQQGVSLNTLVVGLLAGSVDWSLDPEQGMEKMDILRELRYENERFKRLTAEMVELLNRAKEEIERLRERLDG
jgi:hypothetical protein